MFKAIYVVSPEKAEPAKRFVFGFQEQEQCYKWFTTKTGRNLPEFCIIHLESSFGEGSEGSRFSNKITVSFFRVPCRIWNPFAEDLSFYRLVFPRSMPRNVVSQCYYRPQSTELSSAHPPKERLYCKATRTTWEAKQSQATTHEQNTPDLRQGFVVLGDTSDGRQYTAMLITYYIKL